MNNKKILIATIGLLLSMGFSGCAQISPKPSSNNVMDANHIEGEVMTFDETDMRENLMSEDDYLSESGMSLKNSSKDGFQSTYFAFDEYAISGDMYETIQKNIETASRVSGKIKVEGNCDSYGTAEYNYALGLKRAKAVKDAMVSGGVDSSRIIMVSMGESNPACESMSEGCMRSNRRTDFMIVR